MSPIATGIFKTDLKFRNPTNEELKSNPSILGVIEGEHFVPGGFSRNRRYYPENEEYGFLWREQLKRKDLQERIKSHTVFGTIGHDAEITDKELREGIPSHFTTDHQIIETGDPDHPYSGFARSYILNTPTGRILKTYYEAGCNLFTSTRADGTYIPGAKVKNPKTEEMVPVLDPKSYQYERNDFILNPGFLEANPKLKEGLKPSVIKSINEAYEEASNSGVDFSDDNELEKKDADKIPETPAGVPPQNKGDTASKDAVDKGGADTVLSDKEGKTTDTPEPEKKVQTTATEETVAELLQQIEELTAKVKKLEQDSDDDDKKNGNDKDDSSKDIDDKDDFSKDIDNKDVPPVDDDGKKPDDKDDDEKKESIYGELGTPEEVRAALLIANEFFDELGEPMTLKEEISSMRKKMMLFAEKGIDESFLQNVKDAGNIPEVLNTLKSFVNKFGPLDQVTEELNTLRKFLKVHGSLENVENLIKESVKTKLENRAHKLSESTGIDFDKVLNHLNKGMDEDSIIDLYRRVNVSASDRYVFKEETPEVSESRETPSYVVNESESRLGRILKKFGS